MRLIRKSVFDGLDVCLERSQLRILICLPFFRFDYTDGTVRFNRDAQAQPDKKSNDGPPPLNHDRPSFRAILPIN